MNGTVMAAILALGLSACSAAPGPGSGEPASADGPAPAAASTAPPPAATPRQAPPMSDPLPAMQMTCDAEKAMADAIGRPATEANVERARIASGAESVRVIPPDTMVTMEFIESRLNIDVDAENIITNLRCG